MKSGSARVGFQAGLIASAAAGLVMLFARLAWGITTVPELVLDQSTRAVPPTVFAFVLDRLQFAAKPLTLGAIVIGQLLVGGALGVLYEWRMAATLDRPATSRRALVIATAGVLWAFTVLAVLPLAGAGIFGSALAEGPLAVSATLLVAVVVFALVLALLAEWATVPGVQPAEPSALTRRSFLRALATGSVAVVAAGFALRALSLVSANASATQSSRRPTASLPPEVTPTKDFYVVSKNFGDPVVDEATWKLEITGLVENPVTLTYAQLTALPAVDDTVTLECISNEVGGNLISNARWRGVRFRELLALAKPKPGVRKVVLVGADNYDDSIAFDRAMSPANLLAWEMNGEKLTPSHGFPARLLVPGIYGMKNVKWVTKINLVDYDYKGFWQVRGWSDEAYIKTMSRIDVPGAVTTLPEGQTMVGGIAFSGDRGISQVEVSVDDGKTWKRATVGRPLSPYSWVLWALDWPATPGRYPLLVRAYDGSGAPQDSTSVESFPDGASGYHSIVVNIQPAQT